MKWLCGPICQTLRAVAKKRAREYQEEISRLQAELEAQGRAGEAALLEEKKQLAEIELQAELAEIEAGWKTRAAWSSAVIVIAMVIVVFVIIND